MLQIITSAPTEMNMVLRGSLPASLAANGAAATPPMINPMITCQWLSPINEKNVMALARVTKNSVMLTVPITYLGVRPFEISVLVTNGPHPPPPNECKYAPAPASQPTRFTFFCVRFFLNAFSKILKPKSKV